MPMVYYHYTSRQFAQDIHCTTRLNSPSGINYVSPDFYESGAEATQALAITGKPVEAAYIVPDHALHIALSGPVSPTRPVGPITDPLTGVNTRKGHGNEIAIHTSITLNPLQCVNLVSP